MRMSTGAREPPRRLPAAEEDMKKKHLRQWQEILEFIIKICIIILVGYVTMNYVFGVKQIQGQAMYPRVMEGDLVLYYRLDKTYNIGDVVVYGDTSDRVARVVAQEGDIVELSEDGDLIINGNLKEEEIFYPTERIPGSKIDFPYTVESGSYFLLCDYRTISSDSRDTGAVSKEEIKGKIFTIFRRRGF